MAVEDSRSGGAPAYHGAAVTDIRPATRALPVLDVLDAGDASAEPPPRRRSRLPMTRLAEYLPESPACRGSTSGRWAAR